MTEFDENKRCYVFAYGSLMWNPGFDHDAKHRATLRGWSRELCIYSWHWRGTRDQPGLVMGLAPGGACCGMIVDACRTRESDIIDYLDGRELVTDVYERRRLPVELASGQIIQAWCYVARKNHPQFAAGLSQERMVEIIMNGHGVGGANTDYVLTTVDHLLEMGVDEPFLARVTEKIRARS